jgi:hypothetical protein
MKPNDSTNLKDVLPIAEAFRALQVITDDRLITGLDRWRHETNKDSLSSYDSHLASLVTKQPPSKYGHATVPSVWTATHFMLLLPALSYAIKMYGTEDKKTSSLVFTKDELAKHFSAFPHIVRHYLEYQQFVKLFGAPTQEWWDETLQKVFGDISKFASVKGILRPLPTFLHVKVTNTLDGDRDSLVGRIILAYLLNKGIDAETLGIDKRAEKFFSPIVDGAPIKSYYERLIEAQLELGKLQPSIGDYNPKVGLKLGALFETVLWYGRPKIVEMIIPGMVGAAEPVMESLYELFTSIISNGGPDYTKPPLSSIPSVNAFKATQDLADIGRLSLVKDILNDDEKYKVPEGALIRKLMCHVYSNEERLKAWGSEDYYVPDNRTDHVSFNTFKQDIGNILYSAGLIEEAYENPGRVDSVTLKNLADEVKRTRSFNGLRSFIRSNKHFINDLALDWEERYSGHERVRVLRFVQQTFGLNVSTPVPISLVELNKSFAGSILEGQNYSLCYQEAGENLKLVIKLPAKKADKTITPRLVTYFTADHNTKPLTTKDGIPYSAWLEVAAIKSDDRVVIMPVPGRGSYDPFGRVGSYHAGEVVGFGCSVHHSALAIAYAELASLGASRQDLEKVRDAFMRINKGVHERTDMADYQLEQTMAAFDKGEELSISEYLNTAGSKMADSDRSHLGLYFKDGKKSLAWAEPQAARLALSYPAFYPHKNSDNIDPRCTWYDGRGVSIPVSKFQWQTVS